MTMTETVVTTAEVIANQLAENTGIHMLDSGMARGRAWQRNQDRAAAHDMTVLDMFQAEPAYRWDGWGVTLSTFHWMNERLTFVPAMQSRLDRWINLGWIEARHPERGSRYADGPFTNGPGTINDWIDRMIEHDWAEPHPEFGGWTNTYNHDNLLSQDLQFRCFATTDDHPLGADSYVAISTHNGADARGGYSDFKIYECDPYEMFDWDTFGAHCRAMRLEARRPGHDTVRQRPVRADQLRQLVASGRLVGHRRAGRHLRHEADHRTPLGCPRLGNARRLRTDRPDLPHPLLQHGAVT